MKKLVNVNKEIKENLSNWKYEGDSCICAGKFFSQWKNLTTGQVEWVFENREGTEQIEIEW